MKQVFLNLFLNSVDAMKDGGSLTISIQTGGRMSDGKPVITVSIEDTGSGIPDELKETIFEPLFTTKDEEHRIGLGLSVAAGLVRSHGGEIKVDSEAGRGTRFVVMLPEQAPGEVQVKTGTSRRIESS